MTTNDIDNMQIILSTKDGKYFLAKTQSNMLINLVSEFCEFIPINPDMVSNEPLTKYIMEK